ncbi:hypothetical protein V6N13_080249 [Hibiscus sabdariffa]
MQGGREGKVFGLCTGIGGSFLELWPLSASLAWSNGDWRGGCVVYPSQTVRNGDKLDMNRKFLTPFLHLEFSFYCMAMDFSSSCYVICNAFHFICAFLVALMIRAAGVGIFLIFGTSPF